MNILLTILAFLFMITGWLCWVMWFLGCVTLTLPKGKIIKCTRFIKDPQDNQEEK